ncbi:MAG: galactokinase [Phycisphaerae bacterium]
MTDQNIENAFAEMYGRPATGAVRAPGRVNLIGEHTDYNDGFVLPIAIDRDTTALLAPREDAKVNLASLQVQPQVTVRLDSSIQPGQETWANYPRGVIAGLQAAGIDLVGCDILFSSNVPIGGGLSSSASLEVATGMAMLHAAGQLDAIEPYDLALICQKAEHEFAGTPCGIMDQAISVLGQSGKALLLDCESGDTRHVPMDNPELVLLVVDTAVTHDLTDGGYAARREQCHHAASILGIKSLRHATEQMLFDARLAGKLKDKKLMRARHVVGEIRRTLEAVEALETGDYEVFGELMYGSHNSLKNDYEVSCDELDKVVEIARNCDGVYGARMTGGGFGGCAIILAERKHADAIAEKVQKDFHSAFGHACPTFATSAAQGAEVLR